MKLRFILLSFLLLATACNQNHRQYYNLSLASGVGEQHYPILVKEKEQILDITISKDSLNKERNKQQWQKIISFANGYASQRKNERANMLSVMVPINVAYAAKANELGQAIIAKLSLQEKIISSDDIRLIMFDAKKFKKHKNTMGNAPLRLSYHKIFTQTKKCGKWNDLANTYENNNSSNFGCASQHNLAKMIANPKDLLGPRATSDIDAARRARVIDDYRNVLETNTPDDSFQQIDRTEF